MADKKISELPNLADISDEALLVVEFAGKSYNLTGAQWKAYAVEAAKLICEFALKMQKFA